MAFDPYRVYQLYRMFRVHYVSNSYKFGTGLKNTTQADYEKERDKTAYTLLYHKFKNEEDFVDGVSAYFHQYLPTYPRKILEDWDEVMVTRARRNKVLSAPDYHVHKEFKAIITSRMQGVAKLSLWMDGCHSGTISPESLLICEQAFKLVSNLKREPSNPLHRNFIERIAKYNAFIPTLAPESLHAIKSQCVGIPT